MTAAALAATPIFPQNQLVSLDLDGYIDLKERSATQSFLDLGSTMIELVSHAQLGSMILINTSGEKSAAMRL